MNLQSHAQKTRGRLADLSPFEGEESRVPPLVALSHPGRELEGDESPAPGGGESVYGCVEWFHYPCRAHRGSRCGTP